MRKIICPININAKAKEYFRGINFTLSSVSMVVSYRIPLLPDPTLTPPNIPRRARRRLKRTEREPKRTQMDRIGHFSSSLGGTWGLSGCVWRRVVREKEDGKLFYLQLELFAYGLSFFAYSPLRPLLDTLSHCKQKTPIVSKEAKTVSKKARTVS